MLSEGVILFITLNFIFYVGFFKSKKFYFAIGWGKKNLIILVHTVNYTVIIYVCVVMYTYVCVFGSSSVSKVNTYKIDYNCLKC